MTLLECIMFINWKQKVDILEKCLFCLFFFSLIAKLITVTCSAKGRVLLYNQDGRGIELVNDAYLILDGDRVSFSTANIVPKSSDKNNILETNRLMKNQFDFKAPHKLDVSSGLVTLFLGRVWTTDYQVPITSNTPNQLDLVQILQEERKVEDIINFGSRLDQVDYETKTRQTKSIDYSYDGTFLVASIEFSEMNIFPLEYLLLIYQQHSVSMIAIGTLFGQLNGLINTPAAVLNGLSVLSSPNLLLHLALVDCNDYALMTLRRKVLSTSNIITIEVAPKANLFGDLGNGYLIGPNSRITLAQPIRLLKVTKCTQNDLGQPDLATGIVKDVTGQMKNKLVVNSGEATFLVTDQAKSFAFYLT